MLDGGVAAVLLSYSKGKASALLQRRLSGSHRQCQRAGEENSLTPIENRPPAVITKFHKKFVQ